MKLLKQPIKIKDLEIKNRLVMPPMATAKSEDGNATEDLINYYDEKSKGGYIGLVVMEHLYVHKTGIANLGQASISDDDNISGLKRITETIHENGSKIIAQINHAGSSTTPEITGYEPLSASAVVNIGVTGKEGIVPREMNQDDIKLIIKSFADASRRVKEAGFDGVEIHSAHGYLLNQFFSPITNKRNDEYGGSLNNRIKIHLEIIEAIRKVVGKDFVIALRLGACDYMEGGSTIADSVMASKVFEKAGIDLLDISGGLCGFIKPNHNEAGYFREITEAIKKEISIPVILTGGIKTGEEAENLLVEKTADLIGVGRPILKQTNWAKEAMEEN